MIKWLKIAMSKGVLKADPSRVCCRGACPYKSDGCNP